MNRQERRRRAREADRQKRFEERYGDQVIERQNRVDTHNAELFYLCCGLALNKLYGWKANGIQRVLSEMSAQMYRTI